MAKKIDVNYISGIFERGDLDGLSILLDLQQRHKIDNYLWEDNSYRPVVDFALAYTDNSILLKYYVSENDLIANYRNTNDPVYKDSCVEFFIGFDDDVNYYNLEFNCVGTALVEYGTGKRNRIAVDKNLVEKIQSISTINTSGACINWELTLNIPFDVFKHHSFKSLKNKTSRVNFYKCGDLMPQPHFVSWNRVNSSRPDFHLQEYLAPLTFV